MDDHGLKRLAIALGDRQNLEAIGQRVVEDTLRRKAEVESNRKPDGFAIALVFKQGDVIPESFRGLPNMKLDKNGTLLEDWEDGWCQGTWDQADDWDNFWGECWDNTGPSNLAGGIHYGFPPEWVGRFGMADFSENERAVLRRFGIRR